MAKSATIQLKKSTTANAVPTALAVAEPALNTADKKLYSSDGSTVFQVAPSMTEHATKAPLASPTFTGTPTTPTPAADDNSTKVANTSWVRGVIAAISAGVTTFMGRSGNVTLQSSDVTTALGFTPQVALNSVGLLEMTEAFSGNRLSGIDFHSSDGVDYSGRLIREPGANGEMNISQAGSGAFKIYTNVLGVAQAFTFTSDGTFAAPSGIFTGSVRYGTGNAIVYGDGEQVVARSGAAGAEKYFKFGDDGYFYTINGGLSAAGDISTTGRLTINRAWPGVVLNKPASGTTCQIISVTDGSARWAERIGNQDPETGANAGSDFDLLRFSDDGSWLGTPLHIVRATGDILLVRNDWGGGNVGIGTGSPQAKLDVGGDIRASGGLRYTHAINLASGTDFNDVLAAGFYDCAAPVNAPASTWGWLEVQSHSLDANNWVLQRWTRFSVAGPATTWQRRKVGGVWGQWYPLTGYITPEHYGAAGDGSTDDTAAVTAALNSGFPVRLLSPYKITSAITISLASREGINVIGTGSNSRLLLTTTTARLEINNIDPDNPVGTSIDQVVLRDFTIVPNLATTVDVLSIMCAAGDAGSSAPGVRIENVDIIPSSTSYGSTGRQIRLHNARNAAVVDCTAFGQYFAYAGVGIELTSDAGSNPVEIDVVRCNMAHLATSYKLSPASGSTGYDDWEGVSFSKCRGIAVDYGVYAEQGSEYYGGWLVVEGCHFNFRTTGIHVVGARYPKIVGNYLLCGFDGPSTQRGILFEGGNGISPYGTIADNDVCLDWRTAATRVGCRVQVTGGTTTYLRTKVHHNQVSSATSAYDLHSSVNGDNNSSV